MMKGRICDSGEGSFMCAMEESMDPIGWCKEWCMEDLT